MMISRQGFLERAKRFAKQILGRDLWTRSQIRCQKVFLGTDYGGYCICPNNIGPDAIVYSAGIGDDIEFDLEMIRRFKTRIFAFDPTPLSIEWIKSQDLPDSFRFYEYGLADYDGDAVFHPPANPDHISFSMTHVSESAEREFTCQVRRLSTLMNELGHKRIDILKMDIEGAEYAVLDNILKSRLEIDQILVEFHFRKTDGGGVTKTRKIIDRLNAAEYKIFHISPSGYEYSFIHV